MGNENLGPSLFASHTHIDIYPDDMISLLLLLLLFVCLCLFTYFLRSFTTS